MAMTKSEKAAVEALETELAFRWPMEAEPQPLSIPEANDREVRGWTFNSYNTQVEPAWSTSISHGRYFDGKRMSGRQGGCRLYRSERDAYVAMRWDMCRQFAGKLRNVDKRAALADQPA